MICSNCGADNRASAKFCTKCAAQLVPLWPVTVQMEEPPRKRRRRRAKKKDASASLHSAPGGPRLGLYLFTGLLLAAVTAWAIYSITSRMAGQRDVPAVATAPAPAPATPPASETVVPAALVLPASSAPVATASAPDAAGSASSTPHAEAAPAHPASAPPPKPQARKTPRQPAPTPPPVVQVAEPAPAPPPPPPTPASRPAAPVAPATLCSDSQLFAHSVCLQRECSRPGMRQHPQCMRMREQQQVLREGRGDR